MKKLLIPLLCLSMAFTFAACGKTTQTESGSAAGADTAAESQVTSADPADAGSESEPTQTGVPNPFIDCEDIEAAEKAAGFEVTMPESAGGVSDTVVQAIDDELIQVFYTPNPENVQETDYTLIRKAKGTEDISGDYTEYAYTKEIQVDGLTVTLKGFESNNLATWTDGNYSYSIYSCEEISDEAMTELIRSVK